MLRPVKSTPATGSKSGKSADIKWVKHFRCTRTLLAFLILLAVGSVTHAADQTLPNLTGTWTLDAAKSDFGPMPMPLRMVDAIVQTANTMKVKRMLKNEEREATHEFSYQFDGTEVVNQTSANHSRSRAHWEGGVLIVDTQLEVEGLPLKIRDRWEISAQCDCLLISRQFHTNEGDMRMRLVMVRKN